jgi:hypothetical protein
MAHSIDRDGGGKGPFGVISKASSGAGLTGPYSKPWLDEHWAVIEAALQVALPRAPAARFEPWEPGLVPENCATYRLTIPPSPEEALGNLTAYNVSPPSSPLDSPLTVFSCS